MSSRRLLVLVVGSVQCVALAVAEPAIEKDPLLPRALNHTAINTQVRAGNAVLQMSNNWGRLSAGTRLTGTYRVEGGSLIPSVETFDRWTAANAAARLVAREPSERMRAPGD